MSALEHIQASDARLSVWRDAPSLDGARTAALGAFSCECAEAGAIVLRQAAAQLANEGYGAVLGPMDGDTWASHRLVTEGRGEAPFLMEPHNPEHYPAAFDAAGFDIVARYASAATPGDAPIAEPSAIPGVTLRSFDSARAKEELQAVHELSIKAFAGNAFYKPISAERFIGAYLPLLDMIDPELVLLAEDEDGELVGFLFGIPNYAEGPSPSAAILKTYASSRKGVGGLLAREFHSRVRERGFVRVIHALMHERNLSLLHSQHLGARVFRRYALWGKTL